MLSLDGRVVAITGAGGGLGREYALTAAAQGARVVVNDLGGARDGSGSGSSMADTVVEEIRSRGGTAVANYDNIATHEGGLALIGTALDSFGSIDGVVHNAGILRDSSFAKMTEENWDAVLKVHLYGGFHVISAAWPHFRSQKHGRIVVATSTSGLYGNFGQANYGAAKAGLFGLVNTLSIEGAKSGITANAVAPLAATRMTADVAPAEVLDKLPPAHVAPVVVHLLGDACTDSGEVFVVGGGLVQRVELFANKGVTFAEPPTVDEVAARWDEITDMNEAVPGTNPLG
ncbi:SDR family oxidoreductase [Gordonia sp. L191]|uniref:SDR family oxidoreductase n=1 Tax=Gordonia TaxID=2053 RepID=UPI000B99E994|nr:MULTISPECIES: SDR family oxidoreductase [Gordonia]OZC32464.1 serine/threonine protein kinase [Gordonia polyisoprenivorans]UZF55870.1 SDR family oxidoreductase [Gordonia polyisoprenivorans]WHU47411.1 SDR family oxidoreductase [Gordonia sp. L191]